MRQKYLLFPFVALAMLFAVSFTSTPVQAVTYDLTGTPMLEAQEASADVTDQPVGEKSSWGRIKVLYRGLEATTNSMNQDSTSSLRRGESAVGPMNATDLRGFPWPHGDWSSRVLWEAQYALSETYRNGTSRFPSGNSWYGDWDYVNKDPYARDQAMKEAKYQWGYHIGPFAGHYSGGTCTWFVRLVLYRATYWAGYGMHLTTPNFPGSVYSWTDWGHMTRNWGQVRPGFIGSSPGVHMLIFERRGTLNGAAGWWVIDSNWVGNKGNEFIGKHFMTDDQLNTGNYWGWSPSWATTN